MNRKLIFFIAVFCLSNQIQAQVNYAVDQIPADLLKDANAVLREDFASFEILAKDQAVFKVRQVITILNANAKSRAQQVIGYNKNLKVVSFKGTSYDANGKQIKRLKQNEIYDQSAYDGAGSYSDNRLKVGDLSHGSYPYTVEWEFELKFNYLFIIPGFNFGSNYISAEKSTCEFIYPKELKPRFT
jgi:Domain of Unknown Function with PDB structure (DUF3857)